MTIATGSNMYTVAFGGENFDMYTYRPSGVIEGILFAFHGTDRNVTDYRDWSIRIARQRKQVVICPYFDATRFDNEEYHRANVLPDSASSTWTTRFVPLMTAWALGEMGSMPLRLWGFSAGGQFMSRVAAFETIPNLTHIGCAGASTYVTPQVGVYPTGEAVPYGMGDLYASGEEAELTRYLAVRMTLHIGGADNDTADPDMTGGAAAERQGDSRRSRRDYVFNMGQTAATTRGDPFNWSTATAPRVDHSPSRMMESRAMGDAVKFRIPRVV